jgi:hypothetical protein
MSKLLNELWHRIKTRGLIIVLSFFKTCWSAMVLWGKSLDKLGHRTKAAGEEIGLIFLIPGFAILLTMFGLSLADVQIEAAVFASLLSLGLGLTSVGLGFTSVGISTNADKRQTALLEKLDKSVGEELPLLFKGDILTPSGQLVVKELHEKQSKKAVQKRLEEDTRKVGYVRGELFQNADGSWSIHWSGKYPL